MKHGRNLDKTPWGGELLMRTPANCFGDRQEPVGAAILLASDSASFGTVTILPVDGGFPASGVKQESFRKTPRREADQP